MKWYILTLIFLQSCIQQNTAKESNVTKEDKPVTVFKKDTSVKTIHVFVALCDNRQGIVPVPALIGNGEDPDNNLYWGTDFGIKTYFKKSKEWILDTLYKNPKSLILERLVFKHKTQKAYLVADAYDGRYIKNTIEDFVQASSGDRVQIIDNQQFGGGSDVLVYIGHNGLMNFSLEKNYHSKSNHKREVIILACISQSYFASHMQLAKAEPLIVTTQLMCPEAYTVHDALTGWMKGESKEAIQQRAAEAYSRYQKCTVKSAKNLLVTTF
jgi:hypothetical protein